MLGNRYQIVVARHHILVARHQNYKHFIRKNWLPCWTTIGHFLVARQEETVATGNQLCETLHVNNNLAQHGQWDENGVTKHVIDDSVRY